MTYHSMALSANKMISSPSFPCCIVFLSFCSVYCCVVMDKDITVTYCYKLNFTFSKFKTLSNLGVGYSSSEKLLPWEH